MAGEVKNSLVVHALDRGSPCSRLEWESAERCTFCKCSKKIGALQVGFAEVGGPHVRLVEFLVVQVLCMEILA